MFGWETAEEIRMEGNIEVYVPFLRVSGISGESEPLRFFKDN